MPTNPRLHHRPNFSAAVSHHHSISAVGTRRQTPKSHEITGSHPFPKFINKTSASPTSQFLSHSSAAPFSEERFQSPLLPFRRIYPWKMNRCGIQQKSAEERRSLMADAMFCPKPRRLGLLNPSINDQLRPLRLPIICAQTAEIGAEIGDSAAGAELLDIILRKGRCGLETTGYQVASSPPFYSGSPPSRASNPVIQDAHFGNVGIEPLSPAPQSPSSFGHKPAAVRIEGFNCLSRDRRNCSISALA